MTDKKGVVTDAPAARRTVSPGPTPLGGKLVDRALLGAARERAGDLAARLPKLTLTLDQVVTLEMIATGVLSPLEGYPGSKDYASILDRGRLADGTPWTLPPTLAPVDDAGRGVADRVCEGDALALVDASGLPIAILHVQGKD